MSLYFQAVFQREKKKVQLDLVIPVCIKQAFVLVREILNASKICEAVWDVNSLPDSIMVVQYFSLSSRKAKIFKEIDSIIYYEQDSSK